MSEMNSRKGHIFKMNVASLLLLLTMEKLVNGMPFNGLASHSEIGVSQSLPSTPSPALVHNPYIPCKPKEYDHQAQNFKEMETLYGRNKEEIDPWALGIRRLSQEQKDLSDHASGNDLKQKDKQHDLKRVKAALSVGITICWFVLFISVCCKKMQDKMHDHHS